AFRFDGSRTGPGSLESASHSETVRIGVPCSTGVPKRAARPVDPAIGATRAASAGEGTRQIFHSKQRPERPVHPTVSHASNAEAARANPSLTESGRTSARLPRPGTSTPSFKDDDKYSRSRARVSAT